MNRKKRLQNISQTALGLFEGDNVAAQLWITQPVKGLGGRRPIDMVDSDDNARVVLDLIGRLKHGVFS